MPSAYAAPTPPDITGLYSSDYSKELTPVFYIDFNLNVNDLKSEDFYVTGTSTGCIIGSIPSVYAFSFGFQVSNCSDGTVVLNLKANSVYSSEGAWGPLEDYAGTPMQLNRTPLVLTLGDYPVKITTAEMQWKVFGSHSVRSIDYSKVELTGCTIDYISQDVDGATVMASACQHGASAELKLLPGFYRDYFQNLAPAEVMTASAIPIVLDNPPVIEPSPTPTATPTPEPTPTASPTATAQPTPSPTAPVSESSASVVTTNPPTEPPAPPTEPPASPTVQEAVTEVAPSDPEPLSQPEPALELDEDQPVVRPLVRFEPVTTQAEPLPVSPIEPLVEVMPHVKTPIEVIPLNETFSEPAFDWQLIGYLAIAIGSTSAAVGGGLLLKRHVRVRRLKFS